MHIAPLTPCFGAEVSGVDIGDVGAGQWTELERAFHGSGGLLLLRRQVANAEAVTAFAQKFGPQLENNEKYIGMGFGHQLHPQHQEILAVGNALGQNSMMIRVEPEAPLLWHCDDSFRDPQPLGSLFFCLEAPAEGGATWFASGTAALEALPALEQQRLEGFCAVHDYNVLNERLRSDNPDRPVLSEEMRAANPPVLRPLVAQHPRSGRKSLYVPACHIERILPVPGSAAAPASAAGDSAGAELLQSLVEHVTSPPFRYKHQWQAGDCIVWDNRCTLHAPSAFDDQAQRRLMWRITIEGGESEQLSPSPRELERLLHGNPGL